MSVDKNVSNGGYPPDSWSRTEVKYRYAWKIEKFSEAFDMFKNGKEKLFSSLFSIRGPDNMETHWCLGMTSTKTYDKIVTIKGNVSKRNFSYVDEDFSFSVILINLSKVDVTGSFQLSILDSSMNTQNQRRQSSMNSQNNRHHAHLGANFVRYSTLTSQAYLLLPNDSLTIVCDITITGKVKPVFGQDHFFLDLEAKEAYDQDLTEKNAGKLSQDLETAYMNKELTDVQLQCGDKTFDCHQFMLSARSPVFRAMFLTDMMEKETKKVDLVDLDPVVVAEMLHFIYTGETNKMKELAEELLAVADRYQIENLQTLCEEFLCSRLKVDNCIELLVKGDLHYAKNLKRSSLKFISRNRDSFSKSRDWKDTLKNYPELMVEVIEQLFKEP